MQTGTKADIPTFLFDVDELWYASWKKVEKCINEWVMVLGNQETLFIEFKKKQKHLNCYFLKNFRRSQQNRNIPFQLLIL